MSLDPALEAKRQALLADLRCRGRVAVAFSGGTDSALLLAAAVEAIGAGNVVAATVTGPLHTARELMEAREAAAGLGVRHEVFEADPLEVEGFADNPPDRCYICKRHLFGTLLSRARAEAWGAVVEGSNADDAGHYRPGRRALEELGVASPLESAGLAKEEVRRLSRKMGLPTWEKPALACLATRFPYGERLTARLLARVARAEEGLRALGLRVLRLRIHREVARIEAGAEEFTRLAGELRAEAVQIVKEEGFAYVALDLEGYRMGAMDEGLDAHKNERNET